MHIVVGLGNPGSEYTGTRHNVGFEVIDLLAKRHGIAVRKRTMRSVVGDGMIEGGKVLLVKPMTYMNLSGDAVGAVSRMYLVDSDSARRIMVANVIVVVDDINLELGRLRLRLKGSPGGHNGLESIERSLHSDEYPRIRIGVGGAKPGQMIDHVLGKFRQDERDTMREAVELAADAVETALREGFDKAMNTYNRRDE